MKLKALLFFIASLCFYACKTTTSEVKQSSSVSAEISRAITDVVYKNYRDIKGYQEVIDQFVIALQSDPMAVGLAPGELKALYDLRAQNEGAGESKFEKYVAREFAVLTNYLAWKLKQDSQLKYLGPVMQ